VRLGRYLWTAWLVCVCATLVYRSGGAADGAPEPPRAPRADEASTSRAKGTATGFEVQTRLLDALKDARFEAKNLRTGLYALDGHWRKMRAPWIDFTGPAAKAAMSFAVLTSQSEDEAVIPIGSGEVWKPDAKKWNMSEGSFDERDAIFAPTPSRITYDLTIPPEARLTFAMTVSSAPAPTTFAVTVKDARGAVRQLFSKQLPAHSSKGWIDASVDLSDLAGQAVELSLTTEMEALAGRPEAMSLALWGDPLVVTNTRTEVPYNVLWIVIDATRADAVQSFRDDAEDAAKRNARYPPQGALLPKVPGLTPNLDALAARGVRFVHAYSAATWTRPGTVGMLGGARSPELGLDSLRWQLPDEEASRFYASDPPLLPLLLRRKGVEAVGFVNNYFMIGYAAVGADLGFQRIADYRYRTLDTREITSHALDWLEHHKDDRFFLFCNYNSPHEPLEPPARFRAKVPPPPEGPTDDMAARYLGEVGKDDEAVGQLMKALDDWKLRDKTLVVVTADHAETLSEAHDGITALDHMRVRYHHSQGNYEETTHIPVLLSLPGKLPEGKIVTARARNIDLAPTVLDLEGMDPNPKMTGASLLPLARGEGEPSERVVVTDGRGTRAILVGNDRYVVRDPIAQKVLVKDKEVVVTEELYDLSQDPGERRNLVKEQPDKVAEMRARLEAAEKNVPVTGSARSAVVPPGPLSSGRIPEGTSSSRAVSLRFAGAGGAHRVSGTISADGATLRVTPVGLAPEAARSQGGRVEVAFTTSKDAVTGFDLDLVPTSASVRWVFFLDDAPWPADRVYAGAFGLAAPSLRTGIFGEEARAAAAAGEPAFVDAAHDLGLFVTRQAVREPEAIERGRGGAGEEMRRLMREWGYAHGPAQTNGGSK
jgi:choline-sulfatase